MNPDEIRFIESEGMSCWFCGISFSHIHAPKTLPKDFMEDVEEKPKDFMDVVIRDITSKAMTKDGLKGLLLKLVAEAIQHDREHTLELLEKKPNIPKESMIPPPFVQAILDGYFTAVEFYKVIIGKNAPDTKKGL